VLIVAAALAAGCSPEATRTRGGGPGADVGNRWRDAEIHGPTNPFYRTPRVGEGIRR
jgi:hypothetical protein